MYWPSVCQPFSPSLLTIQTWLAPRVPAITSPGSETCERGVSDGPCFDEHSVVFTAQCKHLIAVAVHAKNRVLGLEETDAVLEVAAAAVPVRERPSLGGDVEAPPISGQCGGRVGRQLIESMRRHDLLRAGVDEADTWTVGATPVVAHEHGGRPGHGRGGCNEPPRGLAHEPVTGGKGASRLRGRSQMNTPVGVAM